MESVLYETPQLVEPYLIAGFRGSSNVENVAADTIKHLHSRLHPRLIGRTSGRFYTSSYTPPHMIVKNGLIEQLDFPRIEMHSKENYRIPRHDLVVLSGDEPEDWEKGAWEVIQMLERLNIKRMITIGGIYSLVPHTRPPYVSGAFNNISLKGMLEKANVRHGNYDGPAGFNAVLLTAATAINLDSIGLAITVPNYWHHFSIPYTRGYQTILRILEEMLGPDADFGSKVLEDDAIASDQKMDECLSHNPQLKEQLARLEVSYDENQKAEESDAKVKKMLESL